MIALRQRTFAIGVGSFTLAMIVLVWEMGRAALAVEWMNIFRIDDFQTRGAFEFVTDLRVPIPPNLALIEIANYNLTGDTAFTTGFLYHAYVVAAYVAVLLLAYPSRVRLVISGVLALLFVYATGLIHPGNPEPYDVAAPCFFVCFLFWLRIGTAEGRPRVANVALVLSGAGLTSFELTRPYVVYLLPVVAIMACVRIASRRRCAYFLAPIVLVSGSWHAHLYLDFRQVTASNHFGVNLWRCWHDRIPPLANPLREDNAPLSPGRWPNLNNPQHYENSRRLRTEIRRYIMAHPGDSLAFVAERLAVLTAGQTAIYGHRPDGALLPVYSIAVRITSMIVLVGGCLFVARLAWLLARRRRAIAALVGDLDCIAAFVGAASLFILAIGDGEEEARFVISVLPILAIVPRAHRFVGLDPARILGRIRVVRDDDEKTTRSRDEGAA